MALSLAISVESFCLIRLSITRKRIFWTQRCPRTTLCWESTDPSYFVLCISINVRSHHVCLPFLSHFQKFKSPVSIKHSPAPSLAIGAIAERGRFGSLLVFVFVWSTIVYDPITCWTWGPSGWSAVLGSLDFAGGTPVHINSGTVALAISLYLGRRRGYGTKRLGYKPFKKNTSYIILGTVLLWFGWFGFNGDSTFGTNLRAIQACIQVVMNMAALVGV